jgi:hypothetical protein
MVAGGELTHAHNANPATRTADRAVSGVSPRLSNAPTAGKPPTVGEPKHTSAQAAGGIGARSWLSNPRGTEARCTEPRSTSGVVPRGNRSTLLFPTPGGTEAQGASNPRGTDALAARTRLVRATPGGTDARFAATASTCGNGSHAHPVGAGNQRTFARRDARATRDNNAIWSSRARAAHGKSQRRCASGSPRHSRWGIQRTVGGRDRRRGEPTHHCSGELPTAFSGTDARNWGNQRIRCAARAAGAVCGRRKVGESG